MRTLWNELERTEICTRLDELRQDSPAQWGRMSCSEMLAHLTEAMRMALGELAPKPKVGPLRLWPLKKLVIYALPFPKGAPTAPELIGIAGPEFTPGVTKVKELVHRFGDHAPDGAWPEHPLFGRLTGRDWGVLAYRHLDHHLRQFGV